LKEGTEAHNVFDCITDFSLHSVSCNLEVFVRNHV